MSNFIRADVGRALVAQRLIGSSEVHLAWGNGDPSWSAGPPDLDGSETGLHAEVGRRRATEVVYVVPAADGAIDVGAAGKYDYSPSNDPTGFILCRFEFNLDEGVGEDIKEVGIFFDTVIDGAVPPGQDYILPADVVDPGVLFTRANLAPAEQFTVSGLVRPAWRYIFAA